MISFIRGESEISFASFRQANFSLHSTCWINLSKAKTVQLQSSLSLSLSLSYIRKYLMKSQYIHINGGSIIWLSSLPWKHSAILTLSLPPFTENGAPFPAKYYSVIV